VIEDNKMQATKDEKRLAVQNLGGEEELSPSSLVRKPQWILQTLRDASEDPRIAFREKKIVKMFINYMEFMSNIIDVEPSCF
jgi:hypothetical protein